MSESLRKAIEKITGKNFTQCRDDFSFVYSYEDNEIEDKCLCGKDIKKLYFIKHRGNNTLYTVGSECIKKFNNHLVKDMNTQDFMHSSILNFGKYKGMTYNLIYQKDPAYIKWLMAKPFDELKKMRRMHYDKLKEFLSK